MKHKRIWVLVTLLLTITMLSTTAFAIDESQVESAIAASSREEVAGNIFIWFLCAVAFLKISQKIDSFMSSLGINVGRTGGSMLGELMIAGRAIGAAVKATGGAVGSIFNRNHSSNNSTTNQAAGQGFNGAGHGLIGVAQRAAGNAAASSATGRGSGLGSFVGGAMFGSSLKSGGKFASDVVGAVATGNIASMGSITGKQASEALTSYLGYGAVTQTNAGTPVTNAEPSGPVADGSIPGNVVTPISEPEVSDEGNYGGGIVTPQANTIPTAEGASQVAEDVITPDGGVAAGAVSASAAVNRSIPQSSTPGSGTSVPGQPPTFRNVEIGGGRITGYETPAGGGAERQFAMYNAEQYMEPTGSYETVQTTDGQNWYKQYAEPTVQKTPYNDESGKIKYDEKIVDQMPQIPKRKDRV